jgi:uncharacterized protein (DUF4213/DUF364 family)
VAVVPILEQARERLAALVRDAGLGEADIHVTVAPLSAQEAIGNPAREDYALLEGKEIMIEAQLGKSFGQAFTDHPKDFHGQVMDVLGLSLDTKDNRAIFTATLNAVTAYLNVATKTRHCRDDEPEECAEEIAQDLLARFGKIKIGLIGYQPAILDHLVRVFGVDNVRGIDLNPKNVGTQKFGVDLGDGREVTQELITWSDLVLVTSSALVNNTFDAIQQEAVSRGKHIIMFGVTGAGVSTLTGVERLCFRAH